MGLFGSKTKTTVGTQVMRVIEDKSLPNSVLTGATKSLMDVNSDGNQLSEYILEELSNSMAFKAERMYKYGKSGYIYGLPSSTVKSSQAGKSAAQAAIAAQVGGPVQLSYYHFGPLNNLHVAWVALIASHGYNYTTNKLTTLSQQKGYDVFLKDMQVVVTNASLEEMANGSLDQWGTPANAGETPEKKDIKYLTGTLSAPTPFAVDPSATSDYVRVDYCWEEPTNVLVEGVTVSRKVIKYGSFQIPMTGYDFTADYHQAKYTKSNGDVGFWFYKEGSGNASLDNIFETLHDDNGTFFPFGYLRYEKKSANALQGTAEFNSSKKLFKHLGKDYESLVDSINGNPDIADVEQAMVVMAVPAVTEDPIERRYLFDFFDSIYEQAKTLPNAGKNTTALGIAAKLNDIVNNTGIVIQDKRFKMALNYKQIIKRQVAGSIGEPGTYTSGFDNSGFPQNVPNLSGGTFEWNSNTKKHWYRRQVTKEVYEEIMVVGLQMVYHIYGSYTTTGDEDDEILLIPLDVSIAKQYSIQDREVLYSRGLHFVFNSRVVTKLKWYQTSLFRTLLIVVAIVVTVLTQGASYEALFAAITSGQITAQMIIIFVVTGILEYLIVRTAARLFVKAFGKKFAFIAAIIAAVVSISASMEGLSQYSAMVAKDMLMVANGLVSEINRDLQNDFNQFLEEQSEFEKYVKSQTKLLDSAQDLLTNNIALSPMLIMGESPNDFYQRTVHSGNIGVLGIDMVSSYVDIALQLPKLSDTIGDHPYGI